MRSGTRVESQDIVIHGTSSLYEFISTYLPARRGIDGVTSSTASDRQHHLGLYKSYTCCDIRGDYFIRGCGGFLQDPGLS